MTSHPFASIGTAKSLLRNRIVSAQRIITVAPASPSANMHVTMAAYDGACEHLRSDIMRARKLFPDTNALLTGPQHGVADDALGARSHQRGPYYQNDEGRNRKTAEDILTAPKPEFPTSRSRTHARCIEEATRGAPKDHPPVDEAFKGQATVHRRDFRLRQDRGAAERGRIRPQSPQSL
jgi:hypothetical protein